MKQARERAELTQEKAGEQLELSSHSSVGQWERADACVSLVHLILAAQVYGESLDKMVFGMRGTLEDRIENLPDALRTGVKEIVISAIENAEAAYRRNPQIYGQRFVPDSDPRLTVWSAKDKPRSKKMPAGKKRKGGDE